MPAAIAKTSAAINNPGIIDPRTAEFIVLLKHFMVGPRW
jgi:hypothetical protein